MSKNDITGADIATKPASDAYKAGYDRIYQAQYTETLQEPPESPTVDLACFKGQCTTCNKQID